MVIFDKSRNCPGYTMSRKAILIPIGIKTISNGVCADSLINDTIE